MPGDRALEGNPCRRAVMAGEAIRRLERPPYGAFFTRPFQRVISDYRNWPNSSGELGLATSPMSSKRLRNASPASALRIS